MADVKQKIFFFYLKYKNLFRINRELNGPKNKDVKFKI